MVHSQGGVEYIMFCVYVVRNDFKTTITIIDEDSQGIMNFGLAS